MQRYQKYLQKKKTKSSSQTREQVLGVCVFWISLAHSVPLPTLFAALPIISMQREIGKDGHDYRQMEYILLMTPVSWAAGAIYRHYMVKDKSELRFKFIHLTLCFQYITLVAYIWVPLMSFKIPLYVYVFGVATFDTFVKN